MQNSSSKTLPILVAILVILGIIGYFMYTSGNQTAVDAVDRISLFTGGSEAGSAYSGVGAEVLVLLNRIDSLSIDPKFFNDQVYLSLVDYTVAIPTWSVGRDNPFAPLGGSAVSKSSSSPARR